jgi:hypothetical protein
MKFKPIGVAVLVVLVIFGGVFVSDAMGIWKTSSSKTPAQFETGKFAGLGNPEDIRGSYTFGDIANAFPIEVETLAEAFLVEENPAAFQLKVLEETYPSDEDWEMGTSSVRYFVARYTGLPYERTGEEALFPHAVQMLKEIGKISEEEAEDIPIVQPGVQIQDRDQVSEPDHVEPAVKGNTTVADLFALGLTEEEIVSVIGEYDSKGALVRDVCQVNGVAFSGAKEALLDLVE